MVDSECDSGTRLVGKTFPVKVLSFLDPVKIFCPYFQPERTRTTRSELGMTFLLGVISRPICISTFSDSCMHEQLRSEPLINGLPSSRATTRPSRPETHHELEPSIFFRRHFSIGLLVRSFSPDHFLPTQPNFCASLAKNLCLSVAPFLGFSFA